MDVIELKIYYKMRDIFKYYGMSKAEFARKLGTTRANYSNIENGYVRPTQMLINCLSAMYGLSETWLTDDSQEDLSVLEHTDDTALLTKYHKLGKNYQEFVDRHLDMLLDLQTKEIKGKK